VLARVNRELVNTIKNKEESLAETSTEMYTEV
jgi:hypothetical protein